MMVLTRSTLFIRFQSFSECRNLPVTFGVLFNDDRCANIFEALVGTLRAAKKRKIVSYDGELLLQGVHDNVEIILKAIPTTEVASTAAVKTA
ncbi:costars family protein ABRACL isoform X2 [Cucumis sativus]|uniref:Costars domain-containing protein n=1 Tax=Cucumis sativus TaxID=3659 RepID=A0A0A0KWI0_CUCSA|nr:costars family protein ABRACL isoform X2 [Cucumis sativus]